MIRWQRYYLYKKVERGGCLKRVLSLLRIAYTENDSIRRYLNKKRLSRTFETASSV